MNKSKRMYINIIIVIAILGLLIVICLLHTNRNNHDNKSKLVTERVVLRVENIKTTKALKQEMVSYFNNNVSTNELLEHNCSILTKKVEMSNDEYISFKKKAVEKLEIRLKKQLGDDYRKTISYADADFFRESINRIRIYSEKEGIYFIFFKNPKKSNRMSLFGTWGNIDGTWCLRELHPLSSSGGLICEEKNVLRMNCVIGYGSKLKECKSNDCVPAR